MKIPVSAKTVNAVLIAGPTASGKSALALDVAAHHGGVVVNADSMQVYDTLRVLTARPAPDEMARIPHHLYGHVAAGDAYSVGHWARDVEALLKRAQLKGRIPVFVGGTGLYFKALLGGLSEMPAIPDAIRHRLRNRLLENGPAELFAELKRRDPHYAAMLKAGDSQRIVRGLEVFETSGQSILSFQKKTGRPLIDVHSVRKLVFRPDRDVLQSRIRNRFEKMMRMGAVDEVQELLSLGVEPGSPVMKAIGVREISTYLNGQSSFEETVELATIATRQFAKRQATWFRNQFGEDWQTVDQNLSL